MIIIYDNYIDIPYKMFIYYFIKPNKIKEYNRI